MVELIQQFVSSAGLKELDRWIAKFPGDRKQSAVIQALMIVQEEQGYLTTAAMDAVAAYLEIPAISVYEMAAFYSMYKQKPVGRNMVNVCTNISCQLRDSAAIVKSLEQKLKIKLGETTADGRFTLCAVECLGACVNAPMMQVNKDYHEHLTQDNLDAILDQYP